jgi:hypothetical protein
MPTEPRENDGRPKHGRRLLHVGLSLLAAALVLAGLSYRTMHDFVPAFGARSFPAPVRAPGVADASADL